MCASVTDGVEKNCNTVAVIGAGIAGIHVASALAMQGWRVTLIDSAPDICSGASGNPAGAFHAHVSRDDAPMSRLSRYGIEATLSSLEQLTHAGLLTCGEDWACDGHVQICDSDEDEIRTRETFERLTHLHSVMQWKEAAAIAQDLGITPLRGGLFFRRAGWVKPVAWCKALLSSSKVELRMGMQVTSIRLVPDGACEVLTATTEAVETMRYDRVVIAAARHSLELFAQPAVQSRSVKGQVSLVKAPARLRRVVSGAAYAIEPEPATWLIGATYERPALDSEVSEMAHQQNMQRLQSAFAGIPPLEVTGGRSAIRTMWPDRLPAVGPAIDDRGNPLVSIWFATGFGSRGLTWAALTADIISAWWAGRCPPLPQDLLAAVLPGRFFSRASNSKPTLPSLPKTR